MIAIGWSQPGCCCLCDKPMKKSRRILFKDKYNQRETELFLCDDHMALLRQTLNQLFEDGEQE